MPTPRNLFFALTVLMVSFISLASLAQAPPSADAYVTTAQPASNFGSSILLPVQAGTVSYVRFNLGSLPANATVAKATLRLYVDAVAAPGAFDVYQVESSWSERGLTFNNAPVLGTSSTGGRSTSVTAATLSQFILIDITGLAQGWLNGSIPNYGVALALTSSNGSFSFDSKESTGTGHQPELEVVFGSGAGNPVPTSVTSAVGSSIKKGNLQGNSDPYVDNGTALQIGANFNIEGNGSAASFNAASQYLLAGAPVLGSNGTTSLFVGVGAGQSNTGVQNTFVGAAAGQANSAGNYLTFLGAQSGLSNTTGSFNSFVGVNSGASNTTGSSNIFVGTGAGRLNTAGSSLTFVGRQAGINNSTGNNNSFMGGYSGYYNTTGSNNTFVGFNAGINANPIASNNIYISSLGVSSDNGTIRIGDPVNQTAAYLAGVTGASTSSGVPVFIDSTGKLGTGGGNVSFTQVTGTLTNPQLTGTYSNPVTLSNTANVVDGTFVGNGAGLTGVPSGLAWPIVTKSANYTLQTSDFSTPTTVGNFLIATGTVSLTFKLPNPAPPNGDCVAIGNVIDKGINSGTNTFLTVNSNGLLLDASTSFNGTHPRRSAYLYCSDGTGYYRLGYTQNGVDEIGPWLETLDTGAPNAMTTTFRNGMDLGFGAGVMFYIRPANPNTTTNPTLNVNGFGARPIVKFGNQPLAPNDLTKAAYAHVFYDGTNWQLLNPQTAQGTMATLTGTTGSIGGALLPAGTCTTGTANVTGAAVGHPVAVSASDGSLPNSLIILSAAVASANTVTVQLCAVAAITPAANTYNVATQ